MPVKIRCRSNCMWLGGDFDESSGKFIYTRYKLHGQTRRYQEFFFSFLLFHRLRQINFTFFPHLFIESDFLLLSVLWIIHCTRLWCFLNVGVLWKIEIRNQIFTSARADEPKRIQLLPNVCPRCYLYFATWVLLASTTSLTFSATCSFSNNSIYFPFTFWRCIWHFKICWLTFDHQFSIFRTTISISLLFCPTLACPNEIEKNAWNENLPLDLTYGHLEMKLDAEYMV